MQQSGITVGRNYVLQGKPDEVWRVKVKDPGGSAHELELIEVLDTEGGKGEFVAPSVKNVRRHVPSRAILHPDTENWRRMWREYYEIGLKIRLQAGRVQEECNKANQVVRQIQNGGYPGADACRNAAKAFREYEEHRAGQSEAQKKAELIADSLNISAHSWKYRLK